MIRIDSENNRYFFINEQFLFIQFNFKVIIYTPTITVLFCFFLKDKNI